MNKNYPGIVLVSFVKEHQQSSLAKKPQPNPIIIVLQNAATPAFYRLIRVLHFVGIPAKSMGY